MKQARARWLLTRWRPFASRRDIQSYRDTRLSFAINIFPLRGLVPLPLLLPIGVLRALLRFRARLRDFIMPGEENVGRSRALAWRAAPRRRRYRILPCDAKLAG